MSGLEHWESMRVDIGPDVRPLFEDFCRTFGLDLEQTRIEDEDDPNYGETLFFIPSYYDEGNSPGRGKSGKLRNFTAMNNPKLRATFKEIKEYRFDTEALVAVGKAALARWVI